MGQFMDTYNDLKNEGEFDADKRSEKVKHFELINVECTRIFAKKNKDYGNSFDDSLDEDGLLVAKIRLGDKFKRFARLIKHPAEVEDESIRDTLIDLANYAKMTVMWMDKHPDAIRNDTLNNTEWTWTLSQSGDDNE